MVNVKNIDYKSKLETGKIDLVEESNIIIDRYMFHKIDNNIVHKIENDVSILLQDYLNENKVQFNVSGHITVKLDGIISDIDKCEYSQRTPNSISVNVDNELGEILKGIESEQ